MNKVNYKFLEHSHVNDARVNYSFMQEKEGCKQRCTAVEYMFIEFSNGDDMKA